MAWRASHYAAAGALAAGALAWAARDAWPWRRPLTGPPIVVPEAYVEFADTLGRRETLADALQRGGIRGRDYGAFLAAAHQLNARRLPPGLVFRFRRLKTDSVADRVALRTSPERRLRYERGVAGWTEGAEAIPWTVTRIRVMGTIETSLYDALDKEMPDSFLRAPLQFRRISSRFGSRYHPILGIWRSHEGVDFAAAYGTPVRATADGVVTRVGRDEAGYGNLIELRHANGIHTRYGHLSAFARGLHPGQRVDQGETIGYVGSTGLSTGPHLHYEFLVSGRATNPQRKDMGAGAPVPKDDRPAYDTARTQLLAQREPRPQAAAVAARDD